MRTVSLQSVYEAVVRRHGLDPLGDSITHDTARAICEHITNRCQTAWAMWDWPDLMLTEERAYRAPWNAVTQYRRVNADGVPDEVYYIPEKQYYRVNPAAPNDPPWGSTPPSADSTYWTVFTPTTTFIDRDQLGMHPIGQVFGVYGADPSLNGCCTQNCLPFRPSEKGVSLCHGPAGTVFIEYLMAEPEYTFVPYIAYNNRPYVAGNRVFFTGDGNCYRCIAESINNQAPPDPHFWVLEPVPAAFSTYLKEGAYADSLIETFTTGEDQVRLARAAAADKKATENIQGLIDDLLEQGQKHYYLKNRWYRTSWHYDGMIWWPTTGWCCTRPWSGNIVHLLGTAGYVPTEPPSTGPGVPTQPGMIYLPEIVSLVSPEPSLQSYPTRNLAIDTLAVITIADEEQSWRLDPGPASAGPDQLSPADYDVVTNNKHWTLVSTGTTGGGGAAPYSGTTQLVNGQNYLDVTFGTARPDANWIFLELGIVNTTDASPLNIWPGILTSKTATGFRLQLSAAPDSNNYYLHWAITA